ncbi:hypothetical protein DFQ26_001669 [Actinomortierella ambigua]|nr:hypothetical protein DFQ26_001669 [Actinomortierella ambigua]
MPACIFRGSGSSQRRKVPIKVQMLKGKDDNGGPEQGYPRTRNIRPTKLLTTKAYHVDDLPASLRDFALGLVESNMKDL